MSSLGREADLCGGREGPKAGQSKVDEEEACLAQDRLSRPQRNAVRGRGRPLAIARRHGAWLTPGCSAGTGLIASSDIPGAAAHRVYTVAPP